MNSETQHDAVHGLMRQFLDWLNTQPRTYGEVMDAWRTSCPRLTVWEDAVAQGFVKIETGKPMREALVSLTPTGAAQLENR
ncbi:MAG TPA: hypothetical protein VG711_12020 [Phycisphaerales bacterium]|nr:hypothetical protein [Phycisphaerales bacterium]